MEEAVYDQGFVVAALDGQDSIAEHVNFILRHCVSL